MQGLELESQKAPLIERQLLKTTGMKWIALLFIQLATFGNQYCFDNPQALQGALQTDLNLSLTEYNGLYSFYSLSNFVMPIIWGLAIDRFGNRSILIILTALIVIGQFLVSVAGFAHSYNLMLVGRFIFGLGAESQSFAVNIGVAAWFQGGDLALAQSTQFLVYGVSSSLNSFYSPRLYEKTGSLGATLLIGFWLCVVSLGTAILFVIMDKRDADVEKTIQLNSSSRGVEVEEKGPGLNLWKTMKLYPLLYWIVFAIHFLIAGRYYTFTNMANDLYAFRYRVSSTSAGNILMVFYTMIGIFSPLFGCIVDAFESKGYLMVVIGASCLFSALIDDFQYFIQSTNMMVGLLPLIMLGMMWAFWNAAVWPFIAEILPESILGLAYGLLVISQNVSMFLSPLIGSFIGDAFNTKQSTYFAVLTFIAVLGFLSCILTTWLPQLENRLRRGRRQRVWFIIICGVKKFNEKTWLN